jgi:hypothetical protein
MLLGREFVSPPLGHYLCSEFWALLGKGGRVVGKVLRYLSKVSIVFGTVFVACSAKVVQLRVAQGFQVGIETADLRICTEVMIISPSFNPNTIDPFRSSGPGPTNFPHHRRIFLHLDVKFFWSCIYAIDSEVYIATAKLK